MFWHSFSTLASCLLPDGMQKYKVFCGTSAEKIDNPCYSCRASKYVSHDKIILKGIHQILVTNTYNEKSKNYWYLDRMNQQNIHVH